ncbi:hypothetical protein [Deinococcus sp.]|uniref:hypothetical protein n=1 Tax=Deinococcus sp. TaxID=47478 RepID=UPI003C7AB65D
MTGVAWAVLSAYARTLPAGPERRKVSGCLRAGAPSKMGRNLARVVIAHSGLTHRGKLTAKGQHAARVFLALHGLPLPGPL